MGQQRVPGESADGRVSRRSLLRAGAGGAVASAGGIPLGSGSASAATQTASTDTIVVRWSEAILEAARNSALGPPMLARALAVVHTAVYDAWAAYDALATGTVYGGQLRRPAAERTIANKTEAIFHAAYRAAVDVFPGHTRQFDKFMRSHGYDPHLEPPDGDNSPAGVGVRAAKGLLAYRHRDGSNQLGDLHPGAYSDYTGYQPVNSPMTAAEPIDPATVRDPNRWQPLTHPNQEGKVVTPGFIAPHWTHVKPFAMLSGSQYRNLFGLLLPQHGWPGYRSQAEQVLGHSAGLTDRQKAIAEYWADGPHSEQPPGHWQLFAAFVSRRDGHSLDQDAKLFFATCNAVLDASIASWDLKRASDYVRPITAIRYLFTGQQVNAWAGPGKGTAPIDGGVWTPYQPFWFPTPPFPEYLSGHSAFSAAAAQVLRSFTGSDAFGYTEVISAGSSKVEPGLAPARDVTLHWPTFSEAADEAGISRRYGGIHFEQADLDGRALGRLVGVGVWEKATRHFLGLA
ncbi:MAG: phosphoesterase [Micromonosporaceae bacterium]|nr:phosphoesterase [Micromonosporaceae bacterium]